MLLKWIICRVRAGQRDAFDAAQHAWQALADVDGFRGQLGGWNTEDAHEACIAGLWRDEKSYQRFMDNVHDRITGRTGQGAMYASSQTLLLEVLADLAGETLDLVGAIPRAEMLIVEEYAADQHSTEGRLSAQTARSLARSPESAGFLGGAVCRKRDDASHLLIASAWAGAESDQAVVPLIAHAAFARSGSSIARMTEIRSIRLESAWFVIASDGG